MSPPSLLRAVVSSPPARKGNPMAATVRIETAARALSSTVAAAGAPAAALATVTPQQQRSLLRPPARSMFAGGAQLTNAVDRLALQSIDCNVRPPLSPKRHYGTKASEPTAAARAAAKLPRLPVPRLEETMHRFLYATRALCSEHEMQHVEKVWQDFLRTEGPPLQRFLEERALNTENWLSDWWLDCAYLDGRAPLEITTSPALLFPHFERYASAEGQLQLGGKLAALLMEYKRRVDHDELPVEMAGGAPLDMSQSALVFGTCRQPGHPRDKMLYGKDRTGVRHIVVACNDRFYKVATVTSSGAPLSATQFESQLGRVRRAALAAGRGGGVGALSSSDRTHWAKLHSHLRKNATNAASIECVESAHFLLSLDGEQPAGAQLGDASLAADETHMGMILHGNGGQYSSANRWFDKCMQFVVSPAGYAGLCYEHSPAEGPAVAAVMDFTATALLKDECDFADGAGRLDEPAELRFELDDFAKENIASAKVVITERANDVDVRFLHFDKFGKNVPKTHRMSPDSFLQMAFHLTYYKLHRCFPPTYETGTLRRFHLGRTDTIRLPHPESVDFVVKMTQPSQPAVVKAEAMKRAADAHKDYAVATMSGNGVDRHLLGLRLAAAELGAGKPAVLDTVAYQRMMHFQVSTSQVPTYNNVPLAFGPSAPDCYGICYNPKEAHLTVSISSFRSHPSTSSVCFREMLAASLVEMRQVLEEGAKAKL